MGSERSVEVGRRVEVERGGARPRQARLGLAQWQEAKRGKGLLGLEERWEVAGLGGWRRRLESRWVGRPGATLLESPPCLKFFYSAPVATPVWFWGQHMDGRRRGKLLQSMSFYKQTTESESWSQESQSKIPLAFMGPKAKAWWTPNEHNTLLCCNTLLLLQLARQCLPSRRLYRCFTALSKHFMAEWKHMIFMNAYDT